MKLFILLASLFVVSLMSACKDPRVARLRKSRTVVGYHTIQAALEVYKERNGEYPAPLEPRVYVEIDGQKYDVSGALMLYQSITGDGSDKISMAIPSQNASDGRIGELESKFTITHDIAKSMVLDTEAGRVLVDGYGHPFQYTVPGPKTINESYDLWSFGDSPPIPDPDKAVKLDSNTTAAWTKNW